MASPPHPKSHAQVIIVGAGPVGMLTALRLGQAGINTLVIEGHSTLLNTTRAVVYMPVVIPVLKELGILDTVLSQAYLNTQGVVWRDIEGQQLAQLPLSSSSDEDSKGGNESDFGGVLLLGQSRMNELIQTELRKYPSVEVRFRTKLIALDSSSDSDSDSDIVTLTTHDPKNPETRSILTANYVLGTDGANSTVRNLLGIPFEGFTYDSMRMIGIDVLYDFVEREGFTPLNFVVHPTDWAVVAYTGQNGDGLSDSHDNTHTHTHSHIDAISNSDSHPATNDSRSKASQNYGPNPQWRVAYVESPTLPNDPSSILARAELQMAKYARSSPSNVKNWRILRAEPYTMSQRHAAIPITPSQSHSVMLAGDALHSNNPIGGLGLTGGILDAFCYGNAFIRVLRGGESRALLAECAWARLDAWRGCTDLLSRGNLERLFVVEDGGEGEGKGEVARKREALFAALNGEGKGKVARGVRKGLDGMMVDDFGRGTERFVGMGAR